MERSLEDFISYHFVPRPYAHQCADFRLFHCSLPIVRFNKTYDDRTKRFYNTDTRQRFVKCYIFFPNSHKLNNCTAHHIFDIEPFVHVNSAILSKQQFSSNPSGSQQSKTISNSSVIIIITIHHTMRIIALSSFKRQNY